MNFNFKEGRPLPLPSDPLADAPLACLRLLAGFLICRYRADGASRTCWLDGALCAGAPACRALPRLVVLLRGSPAVRNELDRWFDRELGALAAAFEPLSPFELAALWARQREHLRGRRLAAFLWLLARRNDLPGRRLAARVARGLEPHDLTHEEILRV